MTLQKREATSIAYGLMGLKALHQAITTWYLVSLASRTHGKHVEHPVRRVVNEPNSGTNPSDG